MLETLPKSASTETPWGLSWDALFPSLRPTTAELGTFRAAASAVEGVLTAASVPFARLEAGGPFGKGTLSTGESALDLYVVFDAFEAVRYFDAHLKPILDALSAAKAAHFANVSDRGLAVHFAFEGLACRVFAAGELRAGPKELLLYEGARAPSRGSARHSARHNARHGSQNSASLSSLSAELAVEAAKPDAPVPEERAIHVETSCAVLRAAFVAMQPPLYKDMVRVAKKWRKSSEFMLAEDTPGDYLLELLMLHAFQGAPSAHPSPDLYATIFRRFLALASAHSSSGSDVLADDATPKLFLSWTTFYNQGAIDHAVASDLLRTTSSRGDRSALVVVDPAVPFVNVANTVADWGDFRRFARESLSQFQNSEVLETLQTRLNSLTEGMQEALGEMQKKLEHLESLEGSPRRWSGTIQFREAHMNGDSWTMVDEVQLRTVTWRINARKARTEGVGYSSFVDVSLQMMGKPLTRSMDVDVNFRSGTSNLVFDASTDHVLFARRSEVIRNRDYSIQITVVA